MLDYGCGTVSAGALFIDFLDTGKYIGADISRECLNAGECRIDNLGLRGKSPNLIHLPEGSFKALQEHQFDMIWAQSVFTHMPPDDIKQLVLNLRGCMHSASVFYATFAFTDGEPNRRLFKHWYYNPKFFLSLANETLMKCGFMSDWRYPDVENDKLVKFTLPKF